MKSGQACFNIEDRADAPAGEVEASPPTSGVRENLCTIPAPEGRSAAATVPGAGVDRFAETLAVVDEAFTEQASEWCVDLGGMLITKTTFDLWAAIEQGKIGGNMLVWREGMECWTPVDRVGELACALEQAPPAALLLAEQSPEPAEATTNPELRRPAIELDSPRISSRRHVRAAGGGKWIALGSAVAASAIAAALLTTFLAQEPAPESVSAREPAAAPALPGAGMSRELPEATSIDTVTVAAPLPPKPRHAESGQRRRR